MRDWSVDNMLSLRWVSLELTRLLPYFQKRLTCFTHILVGTRRDTLQCDLIDRSLCSTCLHVLEDDLIQCQIRQVFQAGSSSSRLKKLATSLLRTVFDGSACRVEMN